MSQTTRTKVLIVDDSKLTRVSLRTTLTQAAETLQLVGEAEEGSQAIEVAKKQMPDVVLMDIGMPVMDGIEATRQLRTLLPDTKIIMLTSHESEQDILDAFRCGATSYCLKDTPPESLVHIIEATAGGGCWIDPKIARYVVNRLNPLEGPSGNDGGGEDASSNSLLEPLTEREVDVLKLITEGCNNTQIAEQLCISLNTVKTHLKNIFQKLEVEDRTAAALKALKERLV